MCEGRLPMIDIDGLMTGLAESRKVFHSEADFQHALAWQIHEAMPESRIRLEVDAFPVQDRRRFLDVWMPVEGIAIELKYVTRKLDLEEDGELFALRNHSAQDQRRYDFLLDIERLELMRSGGEVFEAGYAVLLTNDSAYWTVPGSRDTVDAAFRIHEGRNISGELAWAQSAGPGTMKGRESAIRLRGTYQLRWREFSMFPGKAYGVFRYLAVPVID